MTNQEKWIAFCEKQNGEIGIFNKPFWLDAVCGGRGNWDVFLVEENGEIAAAMPYYQKKRMGISYISMPKLTPHTGIWMKPIQNEKSEKRIAREYRLYSQLIEQIEASGVSYYQQCLAPDVRNWQPFFWSEYRQNTLYTFQINHPYNLAQAEKNYSKSTKQNIRRASQAGSFGEFDDIALFYKLNCMTFTRKNDENPITREMMYRVHQACKENGAVKLLCARDAQGNVSDALYLVYDAKSVYSLMCGSVPETRQNNMLTALEHEGIKFACETGRTYDFEGSMLKGVANYNRAFGAEMQPYFCIKKVIERRPVLRRCLKLVLYTWLGDLHDKAVCSTL